MRMSKSGSGGTIVDQDSATRANMLLWVRGVTGIEEVGHPNPAGQM